MDHTLDLTDNSILPRSLGLDEDERSRGRVRRDLLILKAGARLFGLYADETDGITEALRPTPLPQAPPAVLGVVCVRGRMLTVIDPLALMGARRAGQEETMTRGFIVALRGDEQLALMVESAASIMEIFTDQVVPLRHEQERVVQGTFRREGDLVAVLDVQELFTAAFITVKERRRRRS